MTKVQSSEPGLPSRSDSFLRMLELEKRYKMQRIHGHDPATITSPSTSSPSAQPNRPFKARRASGHPPLSHQTQIMKAVRRSSALPSLSISIPPSPTEGPVAGANGLPGDVPSKKEERTKTVTFSDPEEEDDGDSSDQSSICQSPSWEQYGRKKKKKPKKRDSEQGSKSKEDKPTNTLKKKGNRLSKVPPPGVESLVTADRAQSAPELDLYLKSNAAHLDHSDPNLPGAMANPKLDSKPKGRGFLSGFRLQHGNVAAVQKIIESQRVSNDGNPPHPSIAGVEPSFVNPRKPPSIRSGASNSTRSISSLDQLPPSARHSSSSSHGRSQSLLTSTLNKLKGPSYLYYRPGEGPEGIQFQRPSSSHDQDMTSGWLSDQPAQQARRPAEKRPERVKEPPAPPHESTQPLPDFTFPSKPKRVTSHPAPDVATRHARDHTHREEARDINSGYESAEPTSFRNRRTQMSPPRAPSREPVIEKERQPRPERVHRAPRQPIEYSEVDENRPQKARQPEREVQQIQHQQRVPRQVNGYVQPHVESWAESNHEPEHIPSNHYHISDFDGERPDQSDASLSRDEDDKVSIGTHASTIRPGSRRQGHGSPLTDGRKHVTFPSGADNIGRAVTSDEEAEPRPPKPLKSSKPQNPEQFDEVEEIIPIRKPARSERSGDYFSFISQAYAPPTLELRSPMVEGKFPSPRIDEEPEEDDDLDHILRHIPVRSQVHEIATPSESSNHTVASNSSAASRIARQKPAKNSPSLSSHYSDSDVPALERLGISPKAARILAGVETSSTSTSQSNTNPSRTNSERSLSSTGDDTPPSPASAPTPDSSRPQSHKELALRADTGNNVVRSNIDDEEKTPRGNYRAPIVEAPVKHVSRSASRDQKIQDDNWSRTALPIDLDAHSIAAPKTNGLPSSPPLVASPTSVNFTEDIKGSLSEEELANRTPYPHSIPPRAQSALDIHSTSFLPDLKQQNPYPKKTKGGASSISLPSSPPVELVDGAPRKSALRTSRKNSSNSEESSALVTGAAYLQEARKAVPIPPVSSSRALRPHYAHKNSSNSIKSVVGPEGRADPLAKMLVECCNCKFFHDMPSRVYECMAKPDSLVEDKLLGVSATITTMVKCPWCAHGMTTQCCSGFAAVVYLKEKLHGK
ncbi:uncharacterized protein F4822DRAFT_434090 [Hypoxylon trugodes]|uniref:uncharacterized protein n=1 Tax=Hypoxylon trugodes TaxID=326681 RepID=UPI002191FBFC|nr:uncharacterized protein F4822DRAFT_434090 [Hypoxylon trugodes]KAI1384149.1 hypothetical protein F4822DRAFT_434090 [Hypoxylon trugodes]